MGDVDGWKIALQQGTTPHPQIRASSSQPPAPKSEFVVLVTGFGPFPGAPSNTSHLLTKHLPSHLSVINKYNSTSLPIRILNPTAADEQYVKTEYAYIRTYIQDLYDKYQDEVDAIVHLGMANRWEWYSVEERAFNEKFTSDWWCQQEADVGYYMVPDAAGKTVKDISKEEGKGMWDDMPLGLKAAGVNVRIIVDDVKKVVNFESEEERRKEKEKVKIDVISHDEAGNFGCGFIFYESLATCRRRKLNMRVLFCHVPGWSDSERLERGADFVCAVIGAVCRQINPSSPEQIMYPK
ncbi:peptidase C15, pyroglutamyl peptidase I-like protein [Stipitochalara longipes BDJ]|nr:peptidase C15, pyroglutamyl peptidase I-like protein [Stipitochalara longipes BDJ]